MTYNDFNLVYKDGHFLSNHSVISVSPSNMTIQTYNETTPVEAVEGKLSDIECVVGSVKPADITVKWSISGEEIKVDESPGHVTNNDDGSFRVVSKLKYDKFVKRHAGKLLTCEAIHGEDPNYTNTVRERLTVFCKYDQIRIWLN